MNYKKALTCCKNEISRIGYTPSKGSWYDENRAFAFSKEQVGHGMYSSPACIIYAVINMDKITLYRNHKTLSTQKGD